MTSKRRRTRETTETTGTWICPITDLEGWINTYRDNNHERPTTETASNWLRNDWSDEEGQLVNALTDCLYYQMEENNP